ncbi:MAG: prepilin-type N-terminal cleavage/methylation domain-containing protein [Xanthomonadales bacterium]|nr:prepilin-type N-terminal cleavage/methylation domain-containing protein [Xanthomonadales bacterium]
MNVTGSRQLRREWQSAARSRRLGAKRRGSGSLQGFTLIELLLAIGLLALLFGMAYAGLRGGLKAADAGEALIDRTNRVRVTQEFVRHQLSRLLPLAFEQDPGNGVFRVFEGESNRIRYVGPMPGYLGKGGPYVQELEILRVGRERQLVFRHWLLNGFDPDDSDNDDALPVRLLAGIDRGGFEFRTVDDRGEISDWTDDWDEESQTPVMIRLQMRMKEDSRLVWPTLDVAMVVDAGSTRGNAGGTFFNTQTQ